MYETNCDCDNDSTNAKPSLGLSLMVSVLPAVLTILFEKAAETIFHKYREKEEKKKHTGEMIEGSDGNYYYLEQGVVYPVKIEGVVTPAEQKEEEERQLNEKNTQREKAKISTRKK
jgi:hypothetical protein